MIDEGYKFASIASRWGATTVLLLEPAFYCVFSAHMKQKHRDMAQVKAAPKEGKCVGHGAFDLHHLVA
jgi:hypothetical protein